MIKRSSWAKRLGSSIVAASVLLTAAGPGYSAPPGQGIKHEDRRDDRGEGRDRRDDRGSRDEQRDRQYDRGSRDEQRDRGQYRDRDERANRRWIPSQPRIATGRREYRYVPEYRYRDRFRDYRRSSPVIIHRGKPFTVPRDRVRWYRDVVVVRPYGHWYPGYAHYYRDDDAYKWLAFTAITLGLLDYLSEAQQREHEAAQIAATTAPLGERIIWQEGDASGYVVATREGTTTTGRYCREFQQEVMIGGRREEAYGTACRNPDGSWEVVSVDD